MNSRQGQPFEGPLPQRFLPLPERYADQGSSADSKMDSSYFTRQTGCAAIAAGA